MPDLRPLTDADLDAAVELGRARRERLAAHAPRFWRPAADATARHRAFLERAVADPAVLTLATGAAYVVAPGDDSRRVVDDLLVPDDAWKTDGAALLSAVAERTATVRLVVPVAERARRDAAEALGLVPAETWWHRDLPLVQVRGEGGRVQLRTDGATGSLVPAPPVYDPRGSVLLVTEVATGDALAALEAEAAERGATVGVVSQRPDDLMRELLLVEAGYARTTVFLETAP